jgi:HlyD family secretion protein
MTMADNGTAQPALTREALRGRGGRSWGWVAGVALALAAAAAGYLFWRSSAGDVAVRFRTEPVVRGNLVVTVSATGNLQPTNQVDIGSEISGTVEAVLVDDNDRVKKGQVLARLDLSRLNDQVARSSSNLAASHARVEQMVATVDEATAQLERLRQVRSLSGGKVPSQAEMAAAEAALARARAVARAGAVGARGPAAVSEASAALRSDRTNVGKATIKSPIDGVVLSRKVEPGQTVAASLQAPVLFTLAENLAQMELRVDVDEADVGRVAQGQQATFTVDAYSGRLYPAQVKRVGFGSQVKDGVVSYPTVLVVDNDDLSLRPGMTATAEIVTASRENVLLVPNMALRFTPPAAPDAAKAQGGGLVSKLLPRRPRMGGQRGGVAKAQRGPEQNIYVLGDGEPVRVPITVGATDGRMTEVVKGDLAEGAPVVVEALGAPAK